MRTAGGRSYWINTADPKARQEARLLTSSTDKSNFQAIRQSGADGGDRQAVFGDKRKVSAGRNPYGGAAR
jgi:hypothetical protein